MFRTLTASLMSTAVPSSRNRLSRMMSHAKSVKMSLASFLMAQQSRSAEVLFRMLLRRVWRAIATWASTAK